MMSILKPGSLIFLQDYQTIRQNESTNYCLGIGSCNTRPKQRQHYAPLEKVEPFTWGAKRMDTWTWRGADLLLQVRCAVYNGTLGSGFGQRFEPPVGLPSEMAMAA